MALWKFGHFKLVSKISRKVFELGAWNLVSWQGMMSRLPDWILKEKNHFIFPELWPFENLEILNLSARYLKKYLS